MKTMTAFDRTVAGLCEDFDAVEIGRFSCGGHVRAVIRAQRGEHFIDYLVVSPTRWYRLSPSKMSAEARVESESNKLVQEVQDAELLPTLRRIIGYSRHDDPVPMGFKPVRDIRFCQLDRPAWIYAMGGFRRGLIVKVGRTNIEVVFTTESNPGRVYRKSVNPAKTTVMVGY